MAYFGERIKLRRQELGLSQGRLGKMADVTASAISQIESGAIRSVKNETLSRLAVALQMTALELTADLHEESSASLPPNERYLIDCFRQLEPPLQDIALKLIKALQ